MARGPKAFFCAGNSEIWNFRRVGKIRPWIAASSDGETNTRLRTYPCRAEAGSRLIRTLRREGSCHPYPRQQSCADDKPRPASPDRLAGFCAARLGVFGRNHARTRTRAKAPTKCAERESWGGGSCKADACQWTPRPIPMHWQPVTFPRDVRARDAYCWPSCT